MAIDIEQEVKFDSSRIANPDRIFFDLRETKLASTLVGKTFDVDDGFLKKIRVAEFQPGRTRIVLEVDDLSSYDAFLLPDPYRLIIDIHGKQNRATMLAKAHRDGPVTASSADADDEANDSGAPGLKGQKKSEKEHAIVAKADSGEPDAQDQDQDDDDRDIAQPVEPAKPAEKQAATGVVKTTVAVKGSTAGFRKRLLARTLFQMKTLQRRLPAQAAQRRRNGWTVRRWKMRPHAPSSHGKKARSSSSSAPDTADLEIREARPTAAGDRSLTRALGLKIGKIVIDAGHGGHDTGTIGPNGLLEKDLVLDVAKRLGRLLQARLGAEVIYTRQDDTFIPLETRTAIANREQADLFISVHANSSRDSDARGVETYYLNFTSSPEALEVAARENAVSEKSIHELQDLVKKIALKEKIDESREFACECAGLALWRTGAAQRRNPQSRDQESSVHRADRREHAVDPGGDFVCIESGRRTQTRDLRAPAAHRRVAVPRCGKVRRRTERGQGRQQELEKRRPIEPAGLTWPRLLDPSKK